MKLDHPDFPSTMRQMSDSNTENMPLRRCGTSGLKVSAIGLGGWHHFENRDFVRALLTRAFDLGVTHLDLANNYGANTAEPGIAETHTGDVFAAELAAHRDEFIITTKAGYHMYRGPYGRGGSRKYLLSSLDASLRRLRLKYVDIFYHHCPDPETPLEETMGALDQAVRSGRALYAAISNYNPEQTRQATEIARSLDTPLLVNQSKYSMLSRNVESGVLEACRESGLGLVAFSPLEQGILSEKYLEGNIPADSRAAAGTSLRADRIDAGTLEKVRRFSGVAKARGVSLSALALAWVLRDPVVCGVVLGCSRVEQLEENVRALEGAQPFSDGELKALSL